MKTVKKSRKLLLLERDNYKCGIHLGGCGKKLTLEETTVDHIFPKNMDRLGCLKALSKDGQNIRVRDVRLKGLVNLQPMCPKCNNLAKGGKFPTEIKKECPNTCCKYLFLKNETKREKCANHFLLYIHTPAKPVTVKNKELNIYYCYYPLTHIKFMYDNNVVGKEEYVLSGEERERGEKRYVGCTNSVGAIFSMESMVRNNEKYSGSELADACALSKSLTKEDIDAFSKLGLLEYFKR